MLGENIRQLRKQRGITQEELAIRLHVVRQTVSKWEKNRSVPDSEMLQRIAEVLDVSVNELLGAKLPPEPDKNDLAEQLARINEQLAVRNRRSKRIWTVIAIALAALVVLPLLMTVLFFIPGARAYRGTAMATSIAMSDPPIYSEEEVEDAFAVVTDYFKKNFPGCRLNSLSYDEDYSVEQSAGLAEQYSAEEAIVLLSSFSTDGRGGDGSLNANSTYHDWQWILTRTGGSQWTLQDWGYE